MAVERLEHVAIVVEDLAEAVAFFLDLGLELEGETEVEGELVDRIVGLEGVHTELAILVTPDGDGKLEVVQYHSPAGAEGRRPLPANALGLNHVLFRVDDLDATLARLEARGAELLGEVVDYGGVYRLCYLRGPAGVIVELAQRLG